MAAIAGASIPQRFDLLILAPHYYNSKCLENETLGGATNKHSRRYIDVELLSICGNLNHILFMYFNEKQDIVRITLTIAKQHGTLLISQGRMYAQSLLSTFARTQSLAFTIDTTPNFYLPQKELARSPETLIT